MSLTARVSIFFLGALALVLAGFSVAIYWFTAEAWARSAEERLLTTFHALAAAAEIEPDGVEWNPREHHLADARFPSDEPVHWLIETDAGVIIDESDAARELLEFPLVGNLREDGRLERRQGTNGEPWWLVRQRLAASQGGAETTQSLPEKPGDMPEYPALIITAGVSLASEQAMTARLRNWLIPLALVTWGVAAIAGQWFCHRALGPVHSMARAMQGIDSTRPGLHVPVPATGDELESLGRSFNDLLDRIHEVLAREQRFAGEASHQLRTPLTVLRGQIEVALRRSRTTAEYHSLLEELLGQTCRLQQLMEGLLFLARPDADDLETESVELERWFADYVHNFNRTRHANLQLRASASGPCRILAHPALLTQLLDTLIDNAFQLSPEGTPVELTAELSERIVRISVTDHGPGIPPDDLPHLFEPFFRSRSARVIRPDGFGLGLAVATRIAKSLRADIAARNNPGGGATFVVSIPSA